MKGTVFPIEPVLNVCGNFSEYDEYIINVHIKNHPVLLRLGYKVEGKIQN